MSLLGFVFVRVKILLYKKLYPLSRLIDLIHPV